MKQTIIKVKPESLYPFPNNPFKAREIDTLCRSIADIGVLVPLLARRLEGGTLQLVDGHRRRIAAQIAEVETVPVIVMDLDDDAAAITLVDANISRRELLPSERAFALRLKMEAIRHQGVACGTGCHKSRDEVTDTLMGRQVSNYIRLTELICDLLQLVDDGAIAMKPAVELSYLPHRAQRFVLEQISIQQSTPSHAQARRFRQLLAEGKLTEGVIAQVIAEPKPNQVETIRLPMDRLKDFFPRNYTPKQIEDKLVQVLEQWQRQKKARARDAR